MPDESPGWTMPKAAGNALRGGPTIRNRVFDELPKDDGIMMSEIRISDDGSTVVFLRGEAPNREGWSPDPIADPDGPEHAIWAARTSHPGAWRVVDASNPALAPDGSSILFIKSGQILSRQSNTRKAGE